MWTQRAGNQFTARTKLFVPDSSLNELFRDGALEVDQNHLMLVTENEVDASVSIRQPLSVGGTVDPDSPKATLQYMHPAFDYTGKRILFAGGDTWGPTLAESDNTSGAQPVRGGPALFHGHHQDDRRFTEPSDGAFYDAFPTMDPAGRWVYFSRFVYQSNDGKRPGWYLMKVARQYVDSPEPGREDYVLDINGDPVMGYQPLFDSTGRYVLFLRQDPKNIGTDIWYGKLKYQPSLNEWVLDGIDTLVFGEGNAEPTLQPAGDRNAWAVHERFEGKARISHPTLSADGRILAYACDRDGDWDVYTRKVQAKPDGTLEATDEQPVIPPSGANDGTDETWPSISSDGRFVAFQSNRTDAGDARRDDGKTRIWTAGVAAGGGPGGTVEMVEPPPNQDEEQLWPAWEQDDDPPHVLIVLHTSDGAEPIRIRIQDQEPDPIPEPSNASAPRMDVASLAMYMDNYQPPPGPSVPALPPIFFGFGPESAANPTRVNMSYQLPASGASDTGFNAFTNDEDERAHGLHVLFSAKRDSLGLHRSFKEGTGIELVDPNGGTGPGTAATLVEEQFDGMFLIENQRLAVTVYARDNRWLRVGPTQDEDQLYSDDLLIEETELQPKDSRSLPDPKARPPYLQKRSPDDVMGSKKFPGVAWWIEEGPRDGTDERDLDPPRHKNAPFIIFRFANYPPEQYAGDSSRNKDIYLRVVARDLLGNVTDVRIPLHIHGTDFKVNSITRDGQRGN